MEQIEAEIRRRCPLDTTGRHRFMYQGTELVFEATISGPQTIAWTDSSKPKHIAENWISICINCGRVEKTRIEVGNGR